MRQGADIPDQFGNLMIAKSGITRHYPAFAVTDRVFQLSIRDGSHDLGGGKIHRFRFQATREKPVPRPLMAVAARAFHIQIQKLAL